MGLSVIFSFLVNLALIRGRTEVGTGPVFKPDNYTHFDVYASALSKAHYNPWACDYRSEPGYKCLSCSSALHCYPGNFALLVQCAGLFPFCRNGYCSRFKIDGCVADVEPDNSSFSTMPPFLQVFNKVNKTIIAPDVDANNDTHNQLQDSVQEESSSSTHTVATQLKDPNKINEGTVTSTNANVNKKPKMSPYSIQIREVINSL